MDIEILISEVFSRPVLWDQKNKGYHNRVLVEKLWISVATEMKVPKADLKKKWKYLRDQFRNELRKIPIPKSGDGGDTESQITSSWPYFQSLLFLKDQMKYRNLSGNLKPTKAKCNEEEAAIEIQKENEDIFNESQIEDTDDMCNGFELNSKLSTTTKNTANSTAQLLEIEKRKLVLLERKTSEKKTVLDEDEAFFLTLLPHIRKLEPGNKFLCRMEIQNVLYKYVYGNIQNASITRTYNPPELSNESSRYTAVSSPISTSSDNMEDPYTTVAKGKLKLKGEGVKKKKKKKDKKILEQVSKTVESEEKKEVKSGSKRTNAEMAFQKMQEKMQTERILDKASMTHKQRVEKFNQHLDSLTEHFDIPKVSWTK